MLLLAVSIWDGGGAGRKALLFVSKVGLDYYFFGRVTLLDRLSSPDIYSFVPFFGILSLFGVVSHKQNPEATMTDMYDEPKVSEVNLNPYPHEEHGKPNGVCFSEVFLFI